MMGRLGSIAAGILVLSAAAGAIAAAATGKAVTFEAADGVTIYGELYTGGDTKDGPFLLLFHQGGGDARGEYGPLVGRLVEAGYSALAIDQRVGGTWLGGTNRTANRIGKELHYCDAYPDLEAALGWVEQQGFTGPKVAWGSSYSGALALRLAGEHGDRLAAVIAFSPAGGDSMKECKAEVFVEDVAIPAMVLRPLSEMSREGAAEKMEMFRKAGFRTVVADPGVHGSSMLNPDRVEGPVEETWRLVLSFLRDVTSAQ